MGDFDSALTPLTFCHRRSFPNYYLHRFSIPWETFYDIISLGGDRRWVLSPFYSETRSAAERTSDRFRILRSNKQKFLSYPNCKHHQSCYLNLLQLTQHRRPSSGKNLDKSFFFFFTIYYVALQAAELWARWWAVSQSLSFMCFQ